VFDVTTGILDFVKHAFDPFADAIQPMIERFRVLQELVSPFGRPDLVSSFRINFGLPISTRKPLSPKI